MELSWLRYFYTVAQTQNVTLASQRLRVSQPAVTKMVRLLEEHYGDALFLRNRRGVNLTEAGRALYEKCIPIFKQLEAIENPSLKKNGAFAGTFRVGVSDSIAHYLLPRAITKFQKQNPLTQWEVISGTSGEIKKRLIAGEIDYGIFYTQIGLKERDYLEARNLGSVLFVAAAPKQKHSRLTLKELRALSIPYIGARMQDYGNTVPEQWIYNNLGLKIQNTLQINNKETQKRLVLEGAGFAILPKFMIADTLKKISYFESEETKIDLLLVTRKNEEISAAFQQFLNEHLLSGDFRD